MGLLNLFSGRSKKKESAQNAKATTLQTTTVTPKNSLEDLALPAGYIKTPTAKKSDEELKALIFKPGSKTGIFSETNPETGEIEYLLKRPNLLGDLVTLGKAETPDMDALKSFVKQLDKELDKPRVKGGANVQYLETLKATAYQTLTKLAQDKSVTLSPNFSDAIENINIKTQLILNPDVMLDYKKFKNQVTISVANWSVESILVFGQALTKRLEDLRSITTPEEAYEHKDSLISFMKYQEEETSQGKVLSLLPTEEELEANPDSMIRRNTILECAKILADERENLNEDALMYESFLKLVQLRYQSFVQERLQQYQDTIGDDTDKRIAKLRAAGLTQTQIDARSQLMVQKDVNDYMAITDMVNIIEGNKIQPSNEHSKDASTKTKMQDAVVGFMSNERLSGNNTISDYIENEFPNDIRIRAFFSTHPEIEDSQEIIDYYTAKMQFVGQVSNIPSKDSLRHFLEETPIKEPVGKEIPEFLYSVSKIEEQFIMVNFQPILDAYNKLQSRQMSPVR